MNKCYIGISAPARSGKNLFADIASNILKKDFNRSSKSFSLAHQLKLECATFVREQLSMDVWSEKTEEKDLFRGLLIWLGTAKRIQTNGRHWIESLNPNLIQNVDDVNFVTDIRHGEYEKDEIYWIKNELKGKLIYISKYRYDYDGNKIYSLPVIENEKRNDFVLRSNADIVVEWPEKSSKTYIELLEDIELNQIVRKCISDVIF